MELSSLERSLLSSSLPHRRSPAISRHCLSFTPNRGLGNTHNLWRSSFGLDRFGLVLGRAVKSKEDLKKDLGIYEEDDDEEEEEDEEKSVFLTLRDWLRDLRIKMDSEIYYKVLVYGSGSLAALLIISAITSAIDSIPLFPKLMEVVGLGFTIWFSMRYLIFKENRDELFGKVDDLKNQIFGDGDD
ncbi:CURVATURE THYLAKOID protein [Rhynchospora pubera]|uniref:CURVATURE THYLAKOID protein n=1 Tax=Rhynchospora pubera TaxID=906938 RepID=A0AAV8GBZ7_9POAL|nr:CURVATURE THYLAKOID protein [Rhynchospora pubera]KAJ4761051.1 CURVATURE THYLAKOID protein [Rhynchospora pubera]KAJ4801729.1 CURVATURE THYLAKOID protein [Rhynchospora pubera]